MIKRFCCTLLAITCLTTYSFPSQALPPVPEFYEAVAKLPPAGKLGQIIKQEPVKTAIAGAQAWRIAYISSDVAERNTISTAVVVAPSGPAPAGGRPIMAWAHGTTGIAQNCGPSQVLNPASPLNQYFLVGGNSSTDYGLPNLEEFIKQGYVVIGTDYQGLGGGGKHQYAVAGTNGRDLINSARAASSMRETGAGKKVLAYGWSQGGGATIAAASLPDYIAKRGTASDDLEFTGFVALAPDDVGAMMPSAPTDQATADKMIGAIVKMFSGSVFDFAHFSMSVWGTQAAYPDLKLTDIFTEQGAALLDEVISNKCIHVVADTLNYAYGSGYKALVRDQPTNTLAWTKAFIGGSVPAVKPVAPVIIYWGTKDTAVPPIMHQLYQRQMCALGGNIARIQLAGEQTHFTTPGVAAPLYLPWIKERLAGQPLANACP